MSERNGSTKSPAKTVVRNVSDLASNVISLAELQIKLLKTESRQWLRSLIVPLVLLTVAVVVALASVPVLLFSLAHALTDAAGWPLALSLLVAALAALAVVAVVAVLGLRKLRKSVAALTNSRAELSRNIQWIKQMLKNQQNAMKSDAGHSAAHPQQART